MIQGAFFGHVVFLAGGWFDDKVKLQGGFLGGIGQFLLNQGASLLMISHVGFNRD